MGVSTASQRIAIASLFLSAAFSLASCNKAEREWRVAQEANREQAYASFLESHPDSKHASEARDRIRVLRWQQALSKADPDAVEEYIRQYPQAENIGEAKKQLEDLRWTRAKSTATLASLQNFLTAFPGSRYSAQANRQIVELRERAALANLTADSLSIEDARHTMLYGMMSFGLRPSGVLGPARASGPKRVVIFRAIRPANAARAKELGVKPGAAYLLTESGGFKYIRDVDLKLTDEQLCKQFGVRIH